MEGASPSAPEPLDELLLQRYLDGRLTPAEQQGVQELLQRSPAARRALDALREESRLLREALSGLSEPPLRIGDKVLATLHAEHRQRVALSRARRWRNQLLAVVSVAAALLLAVYLFGPRGEAGHLAGGTGASVARGRAEPAPLAKDGKLYEDDTLITGPAQFVRVRLANGTLVDLDEDGRLKIVKSGATPMVDVLAGRARFQMAEGNAGLVVRAANGYVRGVDGAFFEVWLATPTPARAPGAWSGAWTPPAAPVAPPARPKPACVTVFAGTVYAYAAEDVQGVTLEASHRALFGGLSLPLSAGVPFSDRQALDSLREPWSSLDGQTPPGLALLGLFPPFDWKELVPRLGLGSGVLASPAAATDLQDAVKALEAAEDSGDAAERAQRLGQGQQLLRSATQGLPLSNELRWQGRVLEGLAHYERGRALLAVRTGKAKSEAESAFLAAAVACHEALAGARKDLAPVTEVAPGLAERNAPKLSATTRLRELLPVEQALLLARFYKASALFHLKRLTAFPETEGTDNKQVASEDPAALFETAAAALDRSVEGLAARYVQALALAQTSRQGEAQTILTELGATSVAGLTPAARAHVQGLRQWALVEAARLYLPSREWGKLRTAIEAFRLRFPLDSDAPAARELAQVREEAQGLERDEQRMREPVIPNLKLPPPPKLR